MKKFFIIVFIIFIALGAWWWFLGKNKEKDSRYISSVISRGDLLQTVSEVGFLKSAQRLDLSFSSPGSLKKLNVSLGDIVEEGQVLAELDYSHLLIRKQEVEAGLAVAEANLKKLLLGAGREEIAVSEANVKQAEVVLEASKEELRQIEKKAELDIRQAKKNLLDLESENKIETAYHQAIKSAEISVVNIKATQEQLIKNQLDNYLLNIEDKMVVAQGALDQINRIFKDDEIENLFSSKNPLFLTNTKSSYDLAFVLQSESRALLNSVKNEKKLEEIKIAGTKSLEYFQQTFFALDYCFSALENTVTSGDFRQTDLNNYKTIINNQLTALSLAINLIQSSANALSDAELAYKNNVSQAQENLNKAKINLSDAIKSAKDRLSLIEAGAEQQISLANNKVDNANKAWQTAKAQLAQIKSSARDEDIDLLKAQIKQVEASIAYVDKQIEDSLIKAPLAGKVINLPHEIGEQVSALKPIVVLLAGDYLKVEIDISEIDIAKVKIGQKAKITLDALGSENVFNAYVNFIEPSATVIQDVVYYKTDIYFADEPKFKNYQDKLKPGMTANVDIITASKENILLLPLRAVINRGDGSRYVRLLKNEEITESDVVLGLRGDGALVELIKGAELGDEVVTYIQD